MKKHLTFFLIFFFAFLTPISVLAESENRGSANTTRNSLAEERNIKPHELIKEKEDEVRDKIASHSALLKEKLQTKKLEICETRQDIIKKRSQKTAERAETQLNNFSAIADRVDDFYNNKLLPKGVTVASYSALKAQIVTKKANVKTMVDAAKSDAANFNCKGDDPRGQLNNFKTDIKNVVSALKEFRTSIRNFIVAIRTAAAKQKTASGSAKLGE